jgi:hypothetical protein
VRSSFLSIWQTEALWVRRLCLSIETIHPSFSTFAFSSWGINFFSTTAIIRFSFRNCGAQNKRETSINLIKTSTDTPLEFLSYSRRFLSERFTRAGRPRQPIHGDDARSITHVHDAKALIDLSSVGKLQVMGKTRSSCTTKSIKMWRAA